MHPRFCTLCESTRSTVNKFSKGNLKSGGDQRASNPESNPTDCFVALQALLDDYLVSASVDCWSIRHHIGLLPCGRSLPPRAELHHQPASHIADQPRTKSKRGHFSEGFKLAFQPLYPDHSIQAFPALVGPAPLREARLLPAHLPEPPTVASFHHAQTLPQVGHGTQ